MVQPPLKCHARTPYQMISLSPELDHIEWVGEPGTRHGHHLSRAQPDRPDPMDHHQHRRNRRAEQHIQLARRRRQRVQRQPMDLPHHTTAQRLRDPRAIRAGGLDGHRGMPARPQVDAPPRHPAHTPEAQDRRTTRSNRLTIATWQATPVTTHRRHHTQGITNTGARHRQEPRDADPPRAKHSAAASASLPPRRRSCARRSRDSSRSRRERRPRTRRLSAHPANCGRPSRGRTVAETPTQTWGS